MKYLLIMQIIFGGYKNGGVSIETVKLDNINDCERVAQIFMKTNYGGRKDVIKSAKCIKISGSY